MVGQNIWCGGGLISAKVRNFPQKSSSDGGREYDV